MWLSFCMITWPILVKTKWLDKIGCPCNSWIPIGETRTVCRTFCALSEGPNARNVWHCHYEALTRRSTGQPAIVYTWDALLALQMTVGQSGHTNIELQAQTSRGIERSTCWWWKWLGRNSPTHAGSSGAEAWRRKRGKRGGLRRRTLS